MAATARIELLLLLGRAMATLGSLTATNFVPYYSYVGDLAVSGTIGPMITNDTTQTFYYALTGVDTLCTSGANASIANSCGIHVHEGTTCTDDALGHYFTGSVTEDPWGAVSYTASSDGTVSSGMVSVETGATESDVNGRAFIVHGYDGGRIGCAILGDATDGAVALMATAFVKYYSYGPSGALEVSGSVGPLTSVGSVQTFPYSLNGVDPLCTSGPNVSVANSCGVHIHVGATCTDDALGHYFGGSITSDPWGSVAYTSTADAMAVGTVTLDTGITQTDLNGKAVVVHGFDGGRIACAILGQVTQMTLTAANFVPYFSYAGGLNVSGTVGPMLTVGTTQSFQYSLL